MVGGGRAGSSPRGSIYRTEGHENCRGESSALLCQDEGDARRSVGGLVGRSGAINPELEGRWAPTARELLHARPLPRSLARMSSTSRGGPIIKRI